MSAKLRIYVGCALTQAPGEFRESVESFKNGLREHYEVFDFVGLVDGTAGDVYRWDIKRCVATCDLFIAICDLSSIGLGWELGMAVEELKKPVLAVAHEESSVTRLVLGAPEDNPHFTFERYNDLVADLPELIKAKIKAHRL